MMTVVVVGTPFVESLFPFISSFFSYLLSLKKKSHQSKAWRCRKHGLALIIPGATELTNCIKCKEIQNNLKMTTH